MRLFLVEIGSYRNPVSSFPQMCMEDVTVTLMQNMFSTSSFLIYFFDIPLPNSSQPAKYINIFGVASGVCQLIDVQGGHSDILQGLGLVVKLQICVKSLP